MANHYLENHCIWQGCGTTSANICDWETSSLETCRLLFGSLRRILMSSIALLPRPSSSFPPWREGGETWARRSQDHLPCVGLRACLVHVVGFLEHFGLWFVKLWVWIEATSTAKKFFPWLPANFRVPLFLTGGIKLETLELLLPLMAPTELPLIV